MMVVVIFMGVYGNKIKDIKGRASLHKCFALNVPEVSNDPARGSVRAFALLVVSALNLGGLI